MSFRHGPAKPDRPPAHALAHSPLACTRAVSSTAHTHTHSPFQHTQHIPKWCTPRSSSPLATLCRRSRRLTMVPPRCPRQRWVCGCSAHAAAGVLGLLRQGLSGARTSGPQPPQRSTQRDATHTAHTRATRRCLSQVLQGATREIGNKLAHEQPQKPSELPEGERAHGVAHDGAPQPGAQHMSSEDKHVRCVWGVGGGVCALVAHLLAFIRPGPDPTGSPRPLNTAVNSWCSWRPSMSSRRLLGTTARIQVREASP
jgi:hypothetical protein